MSSSEESSYDDKLSNLAEKLYSAFRASSQPLGDSKEENKNTTTPVDSPAHATTTCSSTDAGRETTILTPTTTATVKESEQQQESMSSSLFCPSSAPRAGKVYMIRHRLTDRYLCLKFGLLTLESLANSGHAGRHWLCTENSGWIGFKETVSGNYLGRGKGSGFWAETREQKDREWFHVSKHENEENGKNEYHIHSFIWPELMRVGVNEEGTGLVDANSAEKAAGWDFIEA